MKEWVMGPHWGLVGRCQSLEISSKCGDQGVMRNLICTGVADFAVDVSWVLFILGCIVCSCDIRAVVGGMGARGYRLDF